MLLCSAQVAFTITFDECGNLTSVTIPNSVTYIGDYAFGNCESLESITIPNSVTYIGDYAFAECDALTIRVYSGSYGERYCKNNHLKYTVIVSPFDPSKPTLVIPAGTKKIADEAFRSSGVGQVIVPYGCTSIGSGAFANCASLKSIDIPTSVKTIADDAFSGSTSMTILCEKNSYAENWAKSHNWKYVNK